MLKMDQKVSHCFVPRYKNIKIVDSVQVQVARAPEGVNIPSSIHPWIISASELDLAVKSDIVKSGKVNLVKTYKDLGLSYHGC